MQSPLWIQVDLSIIMDGGRFNGCPPTYREQPSFFEDTYLSFIYHNCEHSTFSTVQLFQNQSPYGPFIWIGIFKMILSHWPPPRSLIMVIILICFCATWKHSLIAWYFIVFLLLPFNFLFPVLLVNKIGIQMLFKCWSLGEHQGECSIQSGVMLSY